MSVFDKPIPHQESAVCGKEKNHYEYRDVVWICGYRIRVPPHVCGFPAEVIEKEVQGNPAKEKYLIDVVSE